MLGEGVHILALFDIPQLDERVKGRGGEEQRLVCILGAWSRGAPLFAARTNSTLAPPDTLSAQAFPHACAPRALACTIAY